MAVYDSVTTPHPSHVSITWGSWSGRQGGGAGLLVRRRAGPRAAFPADLAPDPALPSRRYSADRWDRGHVPEETQITKDKAAIDPYEQWGPSDMRRRLKHEVTQVLHDPVCQRLDVGPASHVSSRADGLPEDHGDPRTDREGPTKAFPPAMLRSRHTDGYHRSTRHQRDTGGAFASLKKARPVSLRSLLSTPGEN